MYNNIFAISFKIDNNSLKDILSLVKLAFLLLAQSNTHKLGKQSVYYVKLFVDFDIE